MSAPALAEALRCWRRPSFGEGVGSVVSRGRRPDLAADALPHGKAPTLLIVGGHDEVVIQLNKQAFARLNCENSAGTARAAPRARDWRHLPSANGTAEPLLSCAAFRSIRCRAAL